MKVLTCITPGTFEYQKKNKPKLKKDHAILKITTIGICGTDLHAYEGTQPYFNYPRTLGHELSGELIELDNAPGFSKGEQVTFIPYFNCGHCIACRSGKPNCCSSVKVCGVHIDGGMAEYLSVPSYTLVHGDGLSSDELALIEPQSIGAHGIRRADIQPNEFVLIVGAGPIGLGAMEFARIAGGKVIAMDVNGYRLSLCKKIGIPFAINANDHDVKGQLREITGNEMPAVVIDATGSQAAINNAFKYMAHGGRYILIGLQKNTININHPEFHKREGTLMSSRNATRDDFEHVINSMKKGLVNPMGYVTNKERFSQVKSKFPDWTNQNSNRIKVLVEMD